MQQNKKIKGAKNVLMFLLYAGPAVIVFTAVILIAFINGIQLTFTDWNGLTDEYQYIGFSNYADAFRDALFWESLLRTFKYAFGVVIITNVIAFLIAFGLTRGYKGESASSKTTGSVHPIRHSWHWSWWQSGRWRAI